MRRVAPVAVAAFLAVAIVACGHDVAPSASAVGAPAGWSELPPSPLSARHGAMAFWTGTELLVLGGTDAAPCPPNADCAMPAGSVSRDGAAFDPASGRWRRIADAPRPLARAEGAVVGGALYLLVGDALLRYASGADRWDVLPPPPGEVSVFRLTAMNDRLLAYLATQEFGVEPDMLFDIAAGTWSPMPLDPLADAHDRTAVWTGREIVLLAIPLELRAPDEPALFGAAILDPASLAWRRLPDSGIIGGWTGWGYAGERVVNAAIGSADGGEMNNWGRPFPFGGMLRPAGIWDDLPEPPTEPGAFLGFASAGGEYAFADGWALHVPSGSWSAIGTPGVTPTDAATVWTGDRLFAWGGVAWNGDGPVILDRGFVWRP